MPWQRPRLLLLLIALALPSGCAMPASSPVPAAAPCAALTVTHYSAAQQARVADEMGAAPADAAWPQFVTDYGRLRAGVRACQEVK